MFHYQLYRGEVDYEFAFVDSGIGMVGIPRYSNDVVRHVEDDWPYLAQNVIEDCGTRIWIDFSNVSIRSSDESGLIPGSTQHIAALFAIASVTSSYNEVNEEQLQQFMCDHSVFSMVRRYRTFEELDALDLAVAHPDVYAGPAPYRDVAVIEALVGPSFGGFYTVSVETRGEDHRIWGIGAIVVCIDTGIASFH